MDHQLNDFGSVQPVRPRGTLELDRPDDPSRPLGDQQDNARSERPLPVGDRLLAREGRQEADRRPVRHHCHQQLGQVVDLVRR